MTFQTAWIVIEDWTSLIDVVIIQSNILEKIKGDVF